MAYTGFVVEIKKLDKHNNADRLQLARVFGTTVVVGLDTKEGDIMAYFPADGKLNYDFAQTAGLLREDLDGNKLDGYMDPKKCNIKAIRLRGERSDGILIPIRVLEEFTGVTFKPGEKLDVVNGTLICEKYVPKIKVNPNTGLTKDQTTRKAKLAKRYPFFEQHKDTNQLAYNLGDFKPEDYLTVTLKLHGTSQRTMKAQVEPKRKILDKILFRYPKIIWETVTGTRRVTLDSYNGGYHGTNEFRKDWNDLFEERLNKGETVYYELVGYINGERSIMPSANNSVLDKKFVKEYGNSTTFDYGLEPGENDIYVYRMNMTNEDGNVVEYSTAQIKKRCEEMNVNMVPVITQFNFESEQHLMDLADALGEGADPIGKTHIKEGVVVRVENSPEFVAYKHKSFEFKVLEGIIKETATEADIEESDG